MSVHFVLASGSPRRTEILTSLGVEHTVHPSDFDEESYVETDPVARAKGLAEQKALSVVDQFSDSYIIGGDTLVVSATGELYEKPQSAEEARAMLTAYQNSHCFVHSGLAIVAPDGTVHSDVQTSTVYYGEISDKFIEGWLEEKIWQGRSGGFKLGNIGQLMFKGIEGEFSSIEGLPIYTFGQLLKQHGIEVADVITFTY